MKYGKISGEEIEKYVKPYTGHDTGDVILGPNPGIDAGVVRLGTRFLAASIDPITATSNMIGEWCVYVATNDVLVTGLEPRWFLLTLILHRRTYRVDPRDTKPISNRHIHRHRRDCVKSPRR